MVFLSKQVNKYEGLGILFHFSIFS